LPETSEGIEGNNPSPQSFSEGVMNSLAELSVKNEKKRYLEHKKSRMAIMVKCRHNRKESELNLE